MPIHSTSLTFGSLVKPVLQRRPQQNQPHQTLQPKDSISLRPTTIQFGTASPAIGLNNPDVKKAIDDNDGAALIALDKQGLVFGPKENEHPDRALLTYLIKQQGFLDLTTTHSPYNHVFETHQIPNMASADRYWCVPFLRGNLDKEKVLKAVEPVLKQDVLIALALMYAQRDWRSEFKGDIPMTVTSYTRRQWNYPFGTSQTTRSFEFDLAAIHDINPSQFYQKILDYAPQIPGGLKALTTDIIPQNVLHLAMEDHVSPAILNQLIAAEPELVYDTYPSRERPMIQSALLSRNIPMFQFFLDYAIQHKGADVAKAMLRATGYEYMGRYTRDIPILQHLLSDSWNGACSDATLDTLRALLEADPTQVLENDKSKRINPALLGAAKTGDYCHGGPEFSTRQEMLQAFLAKAVATETVTTT